MDAQFDFALDTSFSAAAQATYNKALARDGAPAAQLVRNAFAARGITFSALADPRRLSLGRPRS